MARAGRQCLRLPVRTAGVGKLSLWALAAWLAVIGFSLAGAQEGTPANLSEQYLLAAANRDRALVHLPALHVEEHLRLAARLHAREMARHQTISHRFEGERALAERGGDAGAHFSLITENVAEASDSARIHELWMQSANHRDNLLDPAVDAVGIAVVQAHGQLYAVEDFGRTVTTLSLAQQEAAVEQLLQVQGITLQRDVMTEARATCALETGYAGTRLPWFVMRYTAADLSRLPAELTTRLNSRRYSQAAVGACQSDQSGPFTSYRLAVLLYP